MKKTQFLLIADAPASIAAPPAAAPPVADKPSGGEKTQPNPAEAPSGDSAPSGKPKADDSDPFSKLVDAKPKIDETDKSKQPAEKNVAKRKDPIAEQRTRIEQLNGELARIKSENESLKSSQTKADAAAFAEAKSQLEKEISDLRGKIAERDYAQHPDYIEKYRKPFEKSAAVAQKIFESLEITNEDGSTRQAKWGDDFAPIYNSLDRSAALKQAKRLFDDDPNAISTVMSKYDELHALDDSSRSALQEWKTNADAREKTARAEQAAQLENATKAFRSATQNMIEANSDLFQDNPEDAEEVELRKKSMDLVDGAYFGRDKLNPKELLVLDAAIRLRAANFPILKRRFEKLQAENAELLERVSGREKSKSGGKSGGAPSGDDGKSWIQDLRDTVGATT